MDNFDWDIFVSLENKAEECVWAALEVLWPSAFGVPFPGGFVASGEYLGVLAHSA